MNRLKATFKIILMIILLAVFNTGCDRVNSDSSPPIASLSIVQSGLEENGIWLSLEDSKLLIPIYGDFAGEEVEITSSNESVSKIETQRTSGSQFTDDKAVFIEYTPNGSDIELVDYEVFVDGLSVLKDTVQVMPHEKNLNCSGSELGDRFVVSEGGVLTVDLLDNEVFCDIAVSSVAIREFPISNFEGVELTVSSNSALLSYTPPEGFTGRVEFIYELCYDWASVLSSSKDDQIWNDPIGNCPYHYLALVTIDVVGPESI